MREERNVGDVVVLGGGITGIQASLDLAESGFRVYLVDKSPAIGGHMAQFDKVFPTLDCSMCIESPKFIECNRHPNIEILTYTEFVSAEGEAGDFKVSLIKKPRYIIEDRCRGCGICTSYCPVMVPDRFNEDLSYAKSTHIHFAQAVPLVTYIDPGSCLFLLNGKCNICVDVCENKAIDLHQKNEKIDIEVAAIILAPGCEVFDPRLRGDYGYGKTKNVITSLEFERILNADGPFHGEVFRPSDAKVPKKVAWIQCVGSRQVTSGGQSYCSGVCCMYAMKQVMLAKIHDSQLEATIFHNDIRAHGKEFEQFYQRVEGLPGIRFIRSYVSVGKEPPESQNVTLRYSLDSSVREEEFDLVVLSVGMIPPAGIEEIADKLSVKLNSHKFCKVNDSNPVETSRPGIFAAGTFAGPRDIPESIMSGSGAAALCSELLSRRRGKLVTERVYPPERNMSPDEPRTGVFVCR
jgi:heterodisulfide reductase subunit A